MVRSLVAVLGVALLAPSVWADDDDLKRYESRDDRCSALWPARPKESKSTVGSAAGNLTLVTIATSPSSDFTLAVTYVDYPESFAKLDAGDLLKAARDGAKTKGANLLADAALPTAVSDGGVGHPGREFTYDHAKYLTKTRAYLAGTRLYQVSVTGSKDKLNSATAERFLLSFEVRK